MRYLILILILASCSKRECYKCTSTIGPYSDVKVLCDMKKKEANDYEKVNSYRTAANEQVTTKCEVE